jgi:hypothetical protein
VKKKMEDIKVWDYCGKTMSRAVTIHFLKNIKQRRLEIFELCETMLVSMRLDSLACLIDPIQAI